MVDKDDIDDANLESVYVQAQVIRKVRNDLLKKAKMIHNNKNLYISDAVKYAIEHYVKCEKI